MADKMAAVKVVYLAVVKVVYSAVVTVVWMDSEME